MPWFRRESDQRRPRAFEYYLFFSNMSAYPGGGWREINSLWDVRRGDIVAWQLPIVPDQDTGHVLFAAEEPKEIDAGTLALRVYDSADRPHFDDTRGNGEGQFYSGVGSGFINFQVDGSGIPTGFQFAPGEEFTTLPIVIGRLEG